MPKRKSCRRSVGGGHDWATIFSRWGVLSSDTAIAHVVATIGWMRTLASWAWLTWRWMAAQGAR